MTIWERKKERKKQAMIISKMLGAVVWCDGNTSAGPNTLKDIERNTDRELHSGELMILVQHAVRRTYTPSPPFSHLSTPRLIRYRSTLV